MAFGIRPMAAVSDRRSFPSRLPFPPAVKVTVFFLPAPRVARPGPSRCGAGAGDAGAGEGENTRGGAVDGRGLGAWQCRSRLMRRCKSWGVRGGGEVLFGSAGIEIVLLQERGTWSSTRGTAIGLERGPSLGQEPRRHRRVHKRPRGADDHRRGRPERAAHRYIKGWNPLHEAMRGGVLYLLDRPS